MARIREDLDGSVYLHVGGPDGPVVLFAGDEVPEGFEVGAHLLADTEPDEAEELLVWEDDFTTEGGAADESGDPDPSEGPEPVVGPEPADDGAGAPAPKPARPKRVRGPRPKRTRGPAKA